MASPEVESVGPFWDSGRGAWEVLVMACSDWAMGCGLMTGEGWVRLVNSASGAIGGIVAIVTPVEAATEGVVFVLVEVDSGVSAWRADVTSVPAESFVTLVEVRALERRVRKVKIMKRCRQRKNKQVGMIQVKKFI